MNKDSYNACAEEFHPEIIITEEDKRIVDSLTDVHDDGMPDPLPGDQDYHRYLLGAMISEPDIMGQVADILDQRHWQVGAHAITYELARDHYRKYGQCPARLVLIDAIKAKVKDPGKQLYALAEMTAAFGQWAANVEPKEYVLDRLDKFLVRVSGLMAVRHMTAAIGEGTVKTVEDLASHYEEQKAKILVRRNQVAPSGLDVDQLFELATDYDWLIEGRLLRSSLVVVSGRAKGGKTTFTRQLLRDWFAGRAMGQPAAMVPTLYLDFENPLQAFVPALKQELVGHDTAAFKRFFRYFNKSFAAGHSAKLPQTLTLDYLKRVTAGHPPGVVVIDTFRRAFLATPELTPGWENDAATVGKLLLPLQEYCHQTGWTILLIHHLNKMGTASGSTEFQAACDAVWDFQRIVEAGQETSDVRLRIEGRTPYIPPLRWTFGDRGYAYMGTEKDAKTTQRANGKRRAVERIVYRLDHLQPGQYASQSELITDVQSCVDGAPGQKTLAILISELAKAGCLSYQHKQGYSLPEDYSTSLEAYLSSHCSGIDG